MPSRLCRWPKMLPDAGAEQERAPLPGLYRRIQREQL